MNVTIQVPGTFHAFRLAEQLQARNHLNKIITTNPYFIIKKYRPENVNRERVDSIPLRIFQEGFNKIPYVNQFDFNYYINKLFEELSWRKIDNPDIFVGWSGSSLKSIRKAKNKGITTLVERGSSHIEYQNEILREEYGKFGINKELIDRRVIKKELKEYEEADYISIPSEFVKQSFLEKGIDEEKLIKVPYGADIKNLTYKKIYHKKITLLFVGAPPIQKGLFYLLKAVNQLNNDEINLILRTNINTKMEINIFKNLMKKCLVNYIPNYVHKMERLYHSSSILIHPSLQEGLSLVILEAMACGLPVIASENSGSSEFIQNGKNGFIVPIRDVKALKEKINYFYDNPEEIQRMGRTARRTAEKFSWDKYGEEIIKNYWDVLK